MKSLERRIVRLERAWQPETGAGMTWGEYCFFMAIPTIWPDLQTAPKFLQAEHRSLAARWDASRARFQKERTSQAYPSTRSSNG
jgi:hypothetical protein